MLRLSTSAGRSVVSARSMVCTRSTVSLVRPWPVRMIVTSSSSRRSARATSPGSPTIETRLPRTWISASNAPSMIPRNSSPGPSRLTMLMLLGTTTVCLVVGVSVMRPVRAALSIGTVWRWLRHFHATGAASRGPASCGVRLRHAGREGSRRGLGRRARPARGRAAVLVRRSAPAGGRPTHGADPPGARGRDPGLRGTAGLDEDPPPGRRLGAAGDLRSPRGARRDAAVLRLLAAVVEGDLEHAETHLVGGPLGPDDVLVGDALERRQHVAQPLHVLAGDLDGVELVDVHRVDRLGALVVEVPDRD